MARSPLVVALAFAALVGVGAAATGCDSGGGGDDDGEAARAALVAWEQALDPLAFEGGRVVYQGVRQGLADLSSGELPPEQVAEMARTWADQLGALRADITALDAPPELAEVVERLDDAMAGYVRAARALVAAAEGPPEGREAGIDRVVALGEASDEVWDEALAELAAVRERLGVEEPSPIAGVDEPLPGSQP